MNVKDFLSKEWFSTPGTAFDLFGKSINVSTNFDGFENKSEFKAIVLSAPLILEHADTMAADPPDLVLNANTRFKKFAFKARIIDSPNPHRFLPDPCDPDIAKDVDEQLKRVQLHTTFISGDDYQASSNELPKVGDTVIVELVKNVFSYNLQFGAFKNISTAGVPNKDLAQQNCEKLSEGFMGAFTPGEMAELKGHPEAGTREAGTMETRYDEFVQTWYVPSGSQGYFDEHTLEYIVIHATDTDANDGSGLATRWSGPNSIRYTDSGAVYQPGVHFSIGNNGKITQMSDLSDKLVHATGLNSKSLGFELSGKPSKPDQFPTREHYYATAAVCATLFYDPWYITIYGGEGGMGDYAGGLARGVMARASDDGAAKIAAAKGYKKFSQFTFEDMRKIIIGHNEEYQYANKGEPAHLGGKAGYHYDPTKSGYQTGPYDKYTQDGKNPPKMPDGRANKFANWDWEYFYLLWKEALISLERLMYQNTNYSTAYGMNCSAHPNRGRDWCAAYTEAMWTSETALADEWEGEEVDNIMQKIMYEIAQRPAIIAIEKSTSKKTPYLAPSPTGGHLELDELKGA
tara:strand:+ start:547 stop:2265 length:1719 start_codon:yes stop_codon:yes gene_type:complete